MTPMIIRVFALLGLLAFSAETRAQQPWPSNFPDEAWHPYGYRRGFSSDVFKQNFSAVSGGRSIRRTRYERADASSEWNSESGEVVTSYTVTAVTSRNGGDQLYVCGLKDSGGSIIERWDWYVPDRRYIVRYQGPPPPMGTPAGTYVPTVVVKGGGTWSWIPPASPYPIPPQPTKTLLYEGKDTGPFMAASVDPEGRFLLLHDYGSESLGRIVLSSSPLVLEVLYTAADNQYLDKMIDLEVRDYGQEGRKYLSRRKFPATPNEPEEEVLGVFHDPENDGVLNSFDMYPRSIFDATQYANWGNWILLNRL